MHSRHLFDPSFADFLDIKIRKINNKGTAINMAPIDDSFLLDVTIFAKQEGEYRTNTIQTYKNCFCSFIRDDQYLYSNLVTVYDFPDPFPCPFPSVKLRSNSKLFDGLI